MSSDLPETVFILPDILAEWPWKRVINPYSSPQMRAESMEWIRSFVSTPQMNRQFCLGDFCLLCFLAYPLEDKDVLRVACDFVNWMFLLDELSDFATPREAQKMGAIILDTVYNPDKTRPKDECVLGEALRQVWKVISKLSSVAARGRLIKSLEDCATAVVQQAQDRALDYIRDIDEYLPVRRETSGANLGFRIMEFSLNLPDGFFEDPVIRKLNNTCIDLITLSNDLYSYNVEQARGDKGHNIVTILMQHEHFTLNEAITWLGTHASKLVHSFLNDLSHVPHFGPEYQADVERYLNGMGNWVRASDCWSFESGRYFGTEGLEIHKSRKVILLPQQRLVPYK
ncbi:hypothetical protein C0993_008366 [Termitomyces sp. T159_Od127]|nr:hypothetical protein C0993_008366 [Termitomyces sp. T159_Od127]